jgi:hypothetical protein
MTSNIDLEKVAEHFHITMEPKKNEDPADASLRRFKDKWLFIATLIAFMLMFGVCLFLLISKPNSPYAGTALNGVIGLTLALAGYYVRGKSH